MNLTKKTSGTVEKDMYRCLRINNTTTALRAMRAQTFAWLSIHAKSDRGGATPGLSALVRKWRNDAALDALVLPGQVLIIVSRPVRTFANLDNGLTSSCRRTRTTVRDFASATDA